MLTQAQLAATTGLGITQLRKYLARALIDIIENRKKLLDDEDVIIQDVNGKPRYHPIVLSKIQERINHVRDTRYSRSSRTRRRNRINKETA